MVLLFLFLYKMPSFRLQSLPRDTTPVWVECAGLILPFQTQWYLIQTDWVHSPWNTFRSGFWQNWSIFRQKIYKKYSSWLRGSVAGLLPNLISAQLTVYECLHWKSTLRQPLQELRLKCQMWKRIGTSTPRHSVLCTITMCGPLPN